MDPVTQGALGAACSQALLHKQDRKNAWIVGALSGMAADLDIVIQSSHDPMLFLIYHRHFTHSLFFIPIGSLIVALMLLIFKRFRIHWKLTLLASFIGYATHALLDTCTSYGTLLLWPFSNHRYAWDITSIINPYFTIPLFIGVIWTRVFNDRRGVFFGLITAGLVLLFGSIQHYRAMSTVEDYAQKKQLNVRKLRALPTLASTTHWRIAAFSNNKIMLATVNTPLFSKGTLQNPVFFSSFRKSDLPSYVFNTGDQYRDFKIFNWFADGYLVVASQDPFVVIDARYVKGEPLKALWGIQFNPGAKHVKNVNDVTLNHNYPGQN